MPKTRSSVKTALGRGKYNDCYVKNERGEYEYRGEYYVFDATRTALLRLKIAYAALSFAMMAIFVLIGLTDTPGGRVFYVLLPYVAIFLPLSIIIIDAAQLFFLPPEMTRKQYDTVVRQMRRSSIAQAALSSLAILGEVIFIIAGGVFRDELWFLGGLVIIAALAGLLLWLQNVHKCAEKA